MKTYRFWAQSEDEITDLVASVERFSKSDEFDFQITYLSQYIPVAYLRTGLDIEDIRALFPNYDVEQQNTYEINTSQFKNS